MDEEAINVLNLKKPHLTVTYLTYKSLIWPDSSLSFLCSYAVVRIIFYNLRLCLCFIRPLENDPNNIVCPTTLTVHITPSYTYLGVIFPKIYSLCYWLAVTVIKEINRHQEICPTIPEHSTCNLLSIPCIQNIFILWSFLKFPSFQSTISMT